MDILNSYDFKRKKYMPVFPRATGKPTVYIDGYPSEDDEPMAATDFMACRFGPSATNLRVASTPNRLSTSVLIVLFTITKGSNEIRRPGYLCCLRCRKVPGAAEFLHLDRGGCAYRCV